MTYLVNDKCIKCKHTTCVDVCPVDCFYEGKNMLVIKPDECIDCGVCEPECPIDAIVSDTDEGNKSGQRLIGNTQKYGQIFLKPRTSTDHDKYKDEENKFDKYFKENI